MFWALRLLLVVGCIGAFVVSASTAPWQGYLIHRNTAWLMDLGEHPAWRPPPTPDYEAFRKIYEEADDFPQANGQHTIQVNYNRAEVVSMGLVYWWPVMFVCGAMYRLVRQTRRDLILHSVLWSAVGVFPAGVLCLALWCVAGGWGPPVPGLFAFLGMVVGFSCGAVSFATGLPGFHPEGVGALSPGQEAQPRRPG